VASGRRCRTRALKFRLPVIADAEGGLSLPKPADPATDTEQSAGGRPISACRPYFPLTI